MQRRYQAGRKKRERVGVVKETIEKVQAHSQAGPLKGPQFNASQPVLKIFSFLKVDRHFQNCSIKIVAAAGRCCGATRDSRHDREIRRIKIGFVTVHRRHAKPIVN
jgi:rRNA-processing protein FCF1